jgi:hypothetical protein
LAEDTVTLYHFTLADLAIIKVEGLKPGAASWRDWQHMLDHNATARKDVVWLTTDPNLIFTVKRLPTHRLTVDVPKANSRLEWFAEVLRQNGTTAKGLIQDDEAMERFVNKSYIFRGVIPPNRITAIDKIIDYTPDSEKPTGMIFSAVE